MPTQAELLDAIVSYATAHAELEIAINRDESSAVQLDLEEAFQRSRSRLSEVIARIEGLK
jgi:hypothetical protein